MQFYGVGYVFGRFEQFSAAQCNQYAGMEEYFNYSSTSFDQQKKQSFCLFTIITSPLLAFNEFL